MYGLETLFFTSPIFWTSRHFGCRASFSRGAHMETWAFCSLMLAINLNYRCKSQHKTRLTSLWWAQLMEKVILHQFSPVCHVQLGALKRGKRAFSEPIGQVYSTQKLPYCCTSCTITTLNIKENRGNYYANLEFCNNLMFYRIIIRLISSIIWSFLSETSC